MFKRRENLITKLLCLTICTSFLPATVAFAASTNVVQTSEVLTTANSSITDESKFQFNASTGTITGYSGTDAAVNIPSTIKGVKVRSIGDRAFKHCKSLISIVIPNTVTSIGKFVFEDCRNLINITIPSSVTSIGDYAFDVCESLENITVDGSNKNYASVNGILFNKLKTEIIKYPAGKEDESYTIPNYVNSIGIQAFGDSSNLISVTIPNSVTKIGSEAFSGSSITSITIPSSVTTIGDYVFDCCFGLKSITVNGNNKNYTSDKGILFDKLKSRLIKYPEGKEDANYIVPSGVLRIEDDAFENNEGLTSITIPSSVTSMGEYVFDCTSNLTSIAVNSSNKNYTSIDGILFNKLKTQIIKYPEGKGSKTYAIPSGVKNIGTGAFEFSRLSSITIPNSVTTIEEDAFDDCESLSSIVIPNSVTSIGDYAFSWCSNLTSVTMPSSVTTVGSDAFYKSEKAIFHVENQKTKQLLVNSGVDASKIVISGQSVTVKATSVKLNTNTLNLVVGSSGKLIATVSPTNTTN